MCTVRVPSWTHCRHNHGMAAVGRELWAHPDQSAQAHIRVAFGDPQGGAPTASGQPVPGLQHPHTAMLPRLSREPLVSHFGPAGSGPGSVLSAPSPQVVFTDIDKKPSEPPLPQADQAQLSASPQRRDAPVPSSP